MHFLLIINSHLINSHKPINPLFGLNNFQLYFCRLRLIMTFRLMSFTLCFSLLLEQVAQHSLTGWKQPCPLSQTLTLIQSLPRSSSVVLHQCVGLWLPTWHYHTFSRNPVPAWFWVRVDQETNLHKIWKLKVRRTLPLEGHGGQMRQPRARCKGPTGPAGRHSAPASGVTCLCDRRLYQPPMAPDPPLHAWQWDWRWAHLLNCSCKLSLTFQSQCFVWIWLSTVSLTSISLFQTCT